MGRKRGGNVKRKGIIVKIKENKKNRDMNIPAIT